MLGKHYTDLHPPPNSVLKSFLIQDYHWVTETYKYKVHLYLPPLPLLSSPASLLFLLFNHIPTSQTDSLKAVERERLVYLMAIWPDLRITSGKHSQLVYKHTTYWKLIYIGACKRNTRWWKIMICGILYCWGSANSILSFRFLSVLHGGGGGGCP